MGGGHERHGMERSREYSAWLNMKQRCLNPNNKRYIDYGGRGITICDKWLNSFSNFYKDMGKRPLAMTLDRINNDGNYEPGNCRWATTRQQNFNQRIRIDNSSGIKGVTWNKQKRKWVVMFGREYHGAFNIKNEAISKRLLLEAQI